MPRTPTVEPVDTAAGAVNFMPVEAEAEEVVRAAVLPERHPRADRSSRDLKPEALGQMTVYRYRDVLNEAHRWGFRGFRQLHPPIITEVTTATGTFTTAICSVTAIFDDDPNSYSGHSEWQGVGDANAHNCNAMVAKHFIRMADTRAKARALGDALNLDANFQDEFGGDDVEPTFTGTPSSPAARRSASAPAAAQSEFDDRLPNPGPGPYICAVDGCETEIRATAKYSAGKLAQWAIRDYGELRCWDHGRGAQ